LLSTGDALDRDSLSASTVTVLVDGKPVASTPAGRTSTTAASRWPGYGAAHGFAATIYPPRGKHLVCVRAENLSGTLGGARSLACKTLVVHDATGALTSVTRSARTVSVSGWGLDPDTTKANGATLLVDGRGVSYVTAGAYRSYLGSVAPGYGSYHGFRFVRALTRGTHRVCVLGRNAVGTTGYNQSLGCRTVVVP
jgi:hypothetical protein